MKICDVNGRAFKIVVLKKYSECKKTQTGNSMHSENKLMNKMSSLPKRLKL